MSKFIWRISVTQMPLTIYLMREKGDSKSTTYAILMVRGSCDCKVRSASSVRQRVNPLVKGMHISQTSCDVLLSVTDEVLNEAFIYNTRFASSETSIVSYKTEKTVNSHKSCYNIAPRRKFAGIGRPSVPQGLGTEEVDNTSVLQVCRTIGSQYSYNCLNATVQSDFDEPSSSSRSITPTTPKANFVEETRQILVTQPFDQSIDVHGSSIYELSLVV